MTAAEGTTALRAARLSRKPRPWSQERLVYELERAAAVLAVQVAGRASLKVYVSRWENGHHGMSEDYRRLFRHVYGMTDGQLGIADARGGSRFSEPVAFSEDWKADIVSLDEHLGKDLRRRSVLRGAAFVAGAATTPALRWLIETAEAIEATGPGVTVGTAQVETIRQVTRTFRSLDNQFGGGHSREGLVRFLHDDVLPIVRTGTYRSGVAEQLLSATAETTQLAGWMSYDEGQHGLAQRYLLFALRLARASGDRPLGAEILAALSHQASYLGHGREAVDLARVAGQVAAQRGLDALVAEAAVMEAHGHAKAGDGKACIRALGAAEQALDRADRSEDPQWIGYFDEAYLSAKFGHCFKALRRHQEAERFARRSLDMDGAYVRGRAFNLVLLATAQAQSGEVEAACATGSQAVQLTGDLTSQRARDYVSSLREELRPHADHPAVRTFDEEASAMLAKAS